LIGKNLTRKVNPHTSNLSGKEKYQSKTGDKKMKKLLLILCASAVFAACGGGGAGNTATQTTKADSAKPKQGDTVLFKLSREGFGEGKIESVDGSRYKIPYGSQTYTVDEADIYSIPAPGSNTNLKVGDFVIAKRGNENYWAAAEITKADGKSVEVKNLSYGNTTNLSPDQVVAVRPATVEEFKKVKDESGFENKVKTMRPVVPAGYTPKAGDTVVAGWSGNSWYSGKVLSVSSEKAKIKWSVNFSDGDIEFTRIAPQPKTGSNGGAIKAGDIVLVKGSSDNARWEFAEATSATEVKFKDGKTRNVRPDEYIIFN
jgi:hypothetical protein